MTRPEGSTRPHDPPDVTCPVPELADGAAPDDVPLPSLLPSLLPPAPEPWLPELFPVRLPLALWLLVLRLDACAAEVSWPPGSVAAIPAPASTLAAPTATVTARSRARPRASSPSTR
jgi:hypothetical protein